MSDCMLYQSVFGLQIVNSVCAQVVIVHAINVDYNDYRYSYSPKLPHVEEIINIRTPAIIGRSYTGTKSRRYWVIPLKGRWSPPYPATEKWSLIVNPLLR